ncbi:MAG: DUF362 domain-containing protein [Candidatus Aminicenantes bacterium]|nr:MAG: DUF362 domain-containing protein [Candidatus Aminicenantes bacterium]
MGREKVYIRAVPDYDPSRIKQVIQDGLAEFGLSGAHPSDITIKPNVVMAHNKIAPSAFTRSEFMGGLIQALQDGRNPAPKITVTEKCGAGIPTSRMFRRAGYFSLKKRHKIKLQTIEESRKKTVSLKKGEIHNRITTDRKIVDNDFLIYTPKLKSNSLTHGLTAAIKLNVGILCDRERMWNHNCHLDEKIVDLLEVGYPDFIVTDAVEISMGGNHLTQQGYPLGIIIMATNPVAHDSVCARMFHLDPHKIPHLRLAHERGYGPIDPSTIDIQGDISLSAIQEKTKEWKTGFIRVDAVDCNIQVLTGEPYCTGGCHGVFLDWLYMIKDRKPKLWKKLPPWTVVIGKYPGDVKADRVLIIGTCSSVQDRLEAKKIRRIKGCPPRHKDLVLWMFFKTGILNPMFRLDLIIDAYPCLFFCWMRRVFKGRFK